MSGMVDVCGDPHCLGIVYFLKYAILYVGHVHGLGCVGHVYDGCGDGHGSGMSILVP